jgi:hypothetical protein
MTLLADVAALPVLAAGGRTYTWGDVFLAARLRGEWDAIEQRAALGVALEQSAAPPAEDAVKRAGNAFRTERRLLAADELRAWLARRRLTLADWNGFLRRALLLASSPDPADAGAADPAEVIWAEGVCSGAFDGFVQALAERAAALAVEPDVDAGLPAPVWFERAPSREAAARMGVAPDSVAVLCDELWRAEAAHARLRERVIASDAPRKAVASHGVDWLRVDCDLMIASDEDIAREIVLLVREDGVALDEAARRAGLEATRVSVLAGDIASELRARAMSATAGDLVGPVAIEPPKGFAVMAVRGKVAPSMDDPEIRERAERWAIEQALEREVSDRVTFREHD